MGSTHYSNTGYVVSRKDWGDVVVPKIGETWEVLFFNPSEIGVCVGILTENEITYYKFDTPGRANFPYILDECIRKVSVDQPPIAEDTVMNTEQEDEMVEDEEELESCDWCGNEALPPNENGYDIPLCQDCYDYAYTCDHCGDTFHSDNSYYGVNGDYVYCGYDCFSEHWFDCEDCCETRPLDEYDEDGVCIYCRENENRGDIEGYHSSDKTRYKWGNGTKYIGIEWEVDYGQNPGDTWADIKTLWQTGEIYAEDDGSLTEAGFEIITAPMTREYLETKREAMEGTAEFLRYAGYHGGRSEGIGVHIHVDNSWFGELDCEREFVKTKLMLIVETQWDDIVKLCRRNPSSWGGKYDIKDGKELEKIVKTEKYNLNRYRAVNLQPHHTVEFRLFSTTTDARIIYGYVDLVIALINAAHIHDLKDIQSAAKLTDLIAISPDLLYLMKECE